MDTAIRCCRVRCRERCIDGHSLLDDASDASGMLYPPWSHQLVGRAEIKRRQTL